MRRLFACALILLAGCTRPADPRAGSDAFARELAGRVAGQPQSCVTSYPGENLRVVDASTVAYGSGRTLYVNHLRGPCPSLSPLNTIVVDAADGNQYCRNNRIRALEPGSIIPGPWCPLGPWVPYQRP